jgi:hypothetical protein
MQNNVCIVQYQTIIRVPEKTRNSISIGHCPKARESSSFGNKIPLSNSKTLTEVKLKKNLSQLSLTLITTTR